MGMTPLSTAISTRGKLVSGNTDTGMVKARYAPSNPNVRMRKMTGLECRAIQCESVEWGSVEWRSGNRLPDDCSSNECSSSGRMILCEFTRVLRSGYFSLDPSPGALDPSLDPSDDPFAGAAAASILILVLS